MRHLPVPISDVFGISESNVARAVPRLIETFTISVLHLASAPIPKLASFRGSFVCELRNRKGTNRHTCRRCRSNMSTRSPIARIAPDRRSENQAGYVDGQAP